MFFIVFASGILYNLISQSPALLAIQTCMKIQNKDVSKWMSHTKHSII
jgi:hypothetical protein